MISELFFMSGHGIFVWSAYICCGLILAINIIQPRLQLVKLKKRFIKDG